MTSKTWPAPAKLNLFLHIINRRHNGYHSLQTVFQFIDLMDEIGLSINSTGDIRRFSSVPGVAEEEDLIVQAARLLQKCSDCDLGADITINKRIPCGGGLGGGSSDAATTLIALNQLWGTYLSEDDLASIGLELGADVPIFIYGHAAWAEGVGERLTPIKPQETCYLVIHPGCSVSTAAVFNAHDLTRNTPAITMQNFLERGGINDCESVVRKYCAEVDAAMNWLNQYAPAKLTGTGACLFAAFDNERLAQDVKEKIPYNWRGFVVNGMNRSPLLDRLATERSH